MSESVCKIQIQTETLVEAQCEEGCGAELPAGSQRPELAQHVDAELEPDLKLPVLPEVKGFKDQSSSVIFRLSTGSRLRPLYERVCR